MSLFTSNCRICEKTLTIGSNFCTSCGAPTIQNDIVKTKSTANFDPLGKNFKPWRDAPLVAKRVYPELDKKFVTVKVPWCPAMKSRQPRKPKNVVVYKPIEFVEPVVEPVIEEVPVVIPEPPPVVEIFNGELCKEVVASIAVYDATWLPTVALTVVHLNLVEHSISPGNKTYWLRIDVNLEEEDLRDDQGNADPSLPPPVTLAYLSNEAAKFMMSDMDNWVDLPAITANEYYMSQYLQKALDVVARRVSVSLHSSLRQSIPQSYLVMARPVEKIVTVEVSEYVYEYAEESPSNYKRNKQQYQIVCFDTTETEPKSSVTVSNDAGMGEFEFNDSIHSSCCKLKVFGQYRGSSYFLSDVYLSVAYLDRMGCREQNYDENSIGNPEDNFDEDGEWKQPKTHRMNYKQFETTKKVTNVILSIVPRVTSNGVIIPPGKISFEVDSLPHLISIESSPNSVHEAHSAGVPLMALFTMEQFLLNAMEDHKLLPTMIKTLMKIVRIEHDTRLDLVKYMVIGTFAEPGTNIPPRVKRPVRKVKKVMEKFVPIIRDVPDDDDSDEERKERRAARLRKQAEEEALEELEDTSKNSVTDYRCPRHRIYACRCMKQEILLPYYKKKLAFTLFGEYFWHEELRYNELKIEVGESTVAIRQHAIQQYHHYNLEESGSPTSKKRNARVLQLMNTIPQGFEELHLENLFELVDYVKLGYALHFENHVTFVGVHNVAYNKAMSDMVKDEVPDREDYIYNLQIGYQQLNDVLTDFLRTTEFSDEDLNLNIVRDEIHINAAERVLSINFIKCKALGNFFMFNAFWKRIELVFSRDHDLMSLKFA